MKKAIKTVVCVIAVIWLFAAGLILGAFKVRNEYRKLSLQNNELYSEMPESAAMSTTQGLQIDIVTNVAPETEKAVTTEFKLEMPTNAGNITTYESDSKKQLEVPQGKEEIAKALVEAINTTKAMKAFTVTSKEKADFVIDSVTGGNTVKSIVEGIINKLGNGPETTYSFSNGIDNNNGSSETPGSVIAPKNSTAYLDTSAIKSADAKQNSYGGYDITVVLNDETQTLSQKANNHDGIFNTLDMSSISLPSGFSMDRVDFTYCNAMINAGVNSDGRLVFIDYSLPISKGDVQGSMLMANVEVSLHGVYTSSLSMTY